MPVTPISKSGNWNADAPAGQSSSGLLRETEVLIGLAGQRTLAVDSSYSPSGERAA